MLSMSVSPGQDSSSGDREPLFAPFSTVTLTDGTVVQCWASVGVGGPVAAAVPRVRADTSVLTWRAESLPTGPNGRRSLLP